MAATESPPRHRRARGADLAVAALVLVIELAAALGDVDGDPFAPVDGWGLTRAPDTLTFVLVAAGCAALYWRRTRPVPALLATCAAYAGYLLLGHELGLFLAPMVALYTVAALGASRTWAAVAAAAAYAASLAWVHERVTDVTDPGAALLAWVAFAAVIGLFLAGPYVAGELVRQRRMLAARPGPSTEQPDRSTR